MSKCPSAASENLVIRMALNAKSCVNSNSIATYNILYFTEPFTIFNRKAAVMICHKIIMKNLFSVWIT